MLYRGPIWRGEGILNARRGPTGPSLSDYYGTGPGQIPIHHTPSDPSGITLDGGLVTASINRGGAGAVFDLSGVSATAPGYMPGAFDFGGLVNKRLTLANAADLVGVHLIAAIKTGAVTAGSVATDGSNLNKIYWSHGSSSSIRWRYLNGAVTASFTVSTDPSAWHIGEVRIAGGSGWLYWDGVNLGEVVDSNAAFMIALIGSISGSASPELVGDFASVICDSGYSAAAPEPAVLLTRQTLAAQYGVAL